MIGTLLISALLSGSVDGSTTGQTQDVSISRHDNMSSPILRIGEAEIELEIRAGNDSLTRRDIVAWVQRAAEAVAIYYGRFPVERARVIVTQTTEDDHSIHGTTWGNVHGVQALTRMRLGSEVTKSDLGADWTMTHELVHTALSSLADESHWLEEGIATYVEPIARAQAGQLPVQKVWEGEIHGMPEGEPAPGDRGLNQTHSWGRTYWGGAMFCLVADVEIRKATQNRKGLQDALRAIVASGSTIDTQMHVQGILETGDRATGTTVLIDLYDKWKNRPVSVDLTELWHQLGVETGPDGLNFNPSAPLGPIRRGITEQIAQ
jgi:hypothetical protein